MLVGFAGNTGHFSPFWSTFALQLTDKSFRQKRGDLLNYNLVGGTRLSVHKLRTCKTTMPA
jgi:hypothetical protein